MTNPDPAAGKKQKQVPLKICLACGSSWFRQVSIERYSCAEEVISQARMQVLVCLCGTPFEPVIGGAPESLTAAQELLVFWKSFAKTEARIQKCHNSELFARQAAAKLLLQQELDKLAEKALPLEREIGQQLSRSDPKRKSSRGRHWQMPTRRPSAGFRDQVTAALQARGFTFRQARQLVKVFFETIKRALLRGEPVETPFGTMQWEDSPDLQQRRRPLPHRPWRLYVQVLFRSPMRIVIRN